MSPKKKPKERPSVPDQQYIHELKKMAIFNASLNFLKKREIHFVSITPGTHQFQNVGER
jgi:hypothetical protein